MTRNQNSNDGSKKLRGTMLIVALAAVSIAVGGAYSLGLFSNEAQPETHEPLLITLSTDRLDFGDLDLDDIATRQLILRNDGDRPLTANISVSDPSLRVSPEQLILHPGVGSRVVVELDGKRAGSLEDQLTIDLKEEDGAPLVVALAGRVWRDATERPLPAAQETPRVAAKRPTAQPDYPVETEFPRQERQAEPVEAPEALPEDDGSIVIADASVAQRGENRSATGGGSASVNKSSRRPASGASKTPATGSPDNTASDARRSLVRVTEYDPATAVPYRSLAERPPVVPEQITPEESANAKKIPNTTPAGEDGEDLPDRLPEEPAIDDDGSQDRDFNEREEENDPFVTPTLTISGQSTVRVIGHTARFYPQSINVVGTDMGGPIGLLGEVEFPVVPLAFGESMLFAQRTAVVSGGWDPMSGNVQLVLEIQAVDSDGDSAPINLTLTTGIVERRNESNNIVRMIGAPRNPGTGILRLVGMEKIPVGFKNNGEDRLAIFEILASLTFGTSISSSHPADIGNIGG